MSDKYDRAIEFLTEHPEKIKDAWGHDLLDVPAELESDCHDLFGYVENGRGTIEVWEKHVRPDGEGPTPFAGCLTQVKARTHIGQTPELTAAIVADHRIPDDPDNITVDDLPVFAEWQRRIDKELGR